jgi:IS5 family transposase
MLQGNNMIHVKDHKQRDMFNPFAHLGTKRLALLESSWAHLFREEILHKLPAEKLFPFYDEFKGRKTKELYAMLGLVLIQQMEDCTDEQAVQQFAFNLMWQYALNITDASDVASYVSPRTLWNLRDIVARHGLDDALFENVTAALKKLFALDSSKQRLDSVHIFSNMAHLGRIRLFVRTIRTFLTNLKRHHAKEYDALGDIVLRYDKKSDGAFAVKPTESAKKLVELGDDCFFLVERFKANKAVCKMDKYKQLVRMFTEQCIVEKDDNGAKAVIKANKDVPSDSLQNPSDPDAGYCGHKGKGYQMQVMETYSEDKSQPNLITHINVEAANESDANALLPAVEDAGQRDLAPSELLADTLYGSDDNVEKAKEQGITVIAPVMGAKEGATSLADFTFSDTDEIAACPEQQTPMKRKTGKQGGTTVYFDKAICDRCQRQSECPVKRDKKSCSISCDAKSLRLSRRRKLEKEKAFTEKYRYRSGIEGTMSDFDRMTGLKHLRVRGMPQVKLAATLKATGLNILRSVAFKNRLKRQKTGKSKVNPSRDGLYGVIKEQFRYVYGYFLGMIIGVAINCRRTSQFTLQAGS